MNPYVIAVHKKRGAPREVTTDDITLALSYLSGEVSLMQMRQQAGLTLSSCYSFTIRSLKVAYQGGRLRIKAGKQLTTYDVGNKGA